MRAVILDVFLGAVLAQAELAYGRIETLGIWAESLDVHRPAGMFGEELLVEDFG